MRYFIGCLQKLLAITFNMRSLEVNLWRHSNFTTVNMWRRKVSLIVSLITALIHFENHWMEPKCDK